MSTSTVRLQRIFAIVAALVMVLALISPRATEAASSNLATTNTISSSGNLMSATRVGQTQSALRDIPVYMGVIFNNGPMIEGHSPIKKPLDLPYPHKVTNPNANTPAPVSASSVIQSPASAAPTVDRRQPLKRVGDDDAATTLFATWNGLNQGGNRTLYNFGFLPPDTNGDTSGDVYTTGYYVELVNVMMSVWDYSQTNVYGAWPKNVLGPMPINLIWSGFGGACETTNDGDPIVLYDEQADRWLISQFALPIFNFDPNPYAYPFYECIAISKTGDPTGAYWLYEFAAPTTGIDHDYDPGTAQVSGSKMPDYPKFGIWQDGYYMTVNQFTETDFDWGGGGVYVFDRTNMLTGATAGSYYFDPFSANNCSLGTYYTTETNPWCFVGGMLPADNDGAWAPAGTPGYIVEFQDDAWSTPSITWLDQLDLFSVAVNWVDPGVLTWETSLPVNAFDSEVCPGYARNCIAQPNTAQGLDAISDRLMARLQYRNFGTYEAMVVNHTVDVLGAVSPDYGQAGIRWYQLSDTGAGWGVAQQGDFAPDSDNRWMGSAAMDAVGNIAVGYSVSSSDTYPSIRYTYHLASDPLDTMRSEGSIWVGGGSQTSSSARWGDYSSMSIAPSGCDFVYAQQYLRGTTPAEWYTSMGNFAMDSCYSGDVTSPDTTIDIPTTDILSPDATFTFIGTDDTFVDSFACSLDGSEFEDCTSPQSYTNIANGDHTFEVRAIDTSGNIDWTPASHSWTITLPTLSFKSQATRDGYVIESGENSNIGGSLDSALAKFNVGDTVSDRQVRGILSFNTSALPDTAVVVNATLEMRYGGVAGTNPYTTHSPLLVDIRMPFFGGGAGLKISDFQAPASASDVAACGTTAVASWYSCDLTSGFSFVNLLGSTQFRLYFTLDDNDDHGPDKVKFFSGNATAANRPVLTIRYIP